MNFNVACGALLALTVTTVSSVFANNAGSSKLPMGSGLEH
jgi:hypothetical protein